VTEAVNVPRDLDLSILSGDRPWMELARCRGMGRSADQYFFTDTGSGEDDLTDHGRGMRICSRCPVRRQCLEDALTYEDGRRDPVSGRWMRKLPVGVYGGCSVAMRTDRRIRHLEGCDCPTKGNVMPGCRPMGDVLDLLEAWFRLEVRKWLCDDEQVVE
jgi:hypothetical protein